MCDATATHTSASDFRNYWQSYWAPLSLLTIVTRTCHEEKYLVRRSPWSHLTQHCPRRRVCCKVAFAVVSALQPHLRAGVIAQRETRDSDLAGVKFIHVVGERLPDPLSAVGRARIHGKGRTGFSVSILRRSLQGHLLSTIWSWLLMLDKVQTSCEKRT